jgi:hypothetical protein
MVKGNLPSFRSFTLLAYFSVKLCMLLINTDLRKIENTCICILQGDWAYCTFAAENDKKNTSKQKYPHLGVLRYF